MVMGHEREVVLGVTGYSRANNGISKPNPGYQVKAGNKACIDRVLRIFDRIKIRKTMPPKQVFARETEATSTKMVLPNDTNTLGNLFGGQLLAWMDEIASISAHRHCRRVVVTAAVNHVSFSSAVKLGDIVSLKAKVSRSFTSSMETFVDVFVEDYQNGKMTKVNEAIYTFVAVDQLGNAIAVPELLPETEEEKVRHLGALRRRQLSLILSGKMDPDQATELKALFT